jgi:pimeloyl-ACP methyl ester carboxylesterase
MGLVRNISVYLVCAGTLLAPIFGAPLTLAEANKATGYYVDVSTRNAPLRLWVEEMGQGDPLLLIHGLGASTYTWRYFIPDLARNHRVISVDLKGAGKSDKPTDDAYGILDQAAVLKTFVDRMGLSNLTLVGHSMGGGVALALALDLNQTNPGMLKRLVLISSVAYRQQLPFLGFMQKPFLGSDGTFALPPEILVYGGLYGSYYAPSKITFDAVRTYAIPLREVAGQRALIKMAEHIVPPNLQRLIGRYRTIQQPVLMILCNEDKVVPPSLGRKLARDLPHGHLEVLKNCGHIPQEELPKETLALVSAFLN